MTGKMVIFHVLSIIFCTWLSRQSIHVASYLFVCMSHAYCFYACLFFFSEIIICWYSIIFADKEVTKGQNCILQKLTKGCYYLLVTNSTIT